MAEEMIGTTVGSYRITARLGAGGMGLDELEHQRAHVLPIPPTLPLQPVDLRDVRMIQPRQHLRLAFETRHAIRIGRECLWQDLDRNVAADLRITGSAPTFFHLRRGPTRHPNAAATLGTPPPAAYSR